MTSSQDIFSIYYLHYGKEEIIASKKNKSAQYLTTFLSRYGFDTNDDYKWLDNNFIRKELMQDMSDQIFNNKYQHRSKISRTYLGKSMNFKMKFILKNKIDTDTLRNVYAIIV